MSLLNLYRNCHGSSIAGNSWFVLSEPVYTG